MASQYTSNSTSRPVISKKTTTNADGTRTVVTTTTTPTPGGGSVKKITTEQLPSLPSVRRESTTLSDGSTLVKKTTTIVHPGGRREVKNEHEIIPSSSSGTVWRSPAASSPDHGGSSGAASSSVESVVPAKDNASTSSTSKEETTPKQNSSGLEMIRDSAPPPRPVASFTVQHQSGGDDYAAKIRRKLISQTQVSRTPGMENINETAGPRPPSSAQTTPGNNEFKKKKVSEASAAAGLPSRPEIVSSQDAPAAIDVTAGVKKKVAKDQAEPHSSSGLEMIHDSAPPPRPVASFTVQHQSGGDDYLAKIQRKLYSQNQSPQRSALETIEDTAGPLPPSAETISGGSEFERKKVSAALPTIRSHQDDRPGSDQIQPTRIVTAPAVGISDDVAGSTDNASAGAPERDGDYVVSSAVLVDSANWGQTSQQPEPSLPHQQQPQPQPQTQQQRQPQPPPPPQIQQQQTQAQSQGQPQQQQPQAQSQGQPQQQQQYTHFQQPPSNLHRTQQTNTNQQQKQQTQFQQQPSILQYPMPPNIVQDEPIQAVPVPESEPPKRNKKCLMIGSAIAALILVAVGAALGATLSKNNDSNPTGPESSVSQPGLPAPPSPADPVPPSPDLPATPSPPSPKPPFSGGTPVPPPSPADPTPPVAGLPAAPSPPSPKPPFSESGNNPTEPVAPNFCLSEDTFEYCFESECDNVAGCDSCESFVRDTSTKEVKGYCDQCGTCESGDIFFDCTNIGFRNVDCEEAVPSPPSPFLGSPRPTSRPTLGLTPRPTPRPTLRPTFGSTPRPTPRPTTRPTFGSTSWIPTSDSLSVTLEGEYFCAESTEGVEFCVAFQCQDPGCDCDSYFRDSVSKVTIGTCSACTVCGFSTENFLDMTCNLYGVEADLDC